MAANYGFTPPPPPPPLPARVPATLNDLRLAISLVDKSLRLCSADHRSTYTARDVQNLLLDVRNTLERLTATTTLLAIAVEINDETRQLKEAMDHDADQA